ncbi:hypothetical protein CF336_g7193 [Tilletia laevis]|nr:hypothetical protein CF335_g7864 [Tilletia laevis]KAE8185938.1 hypothetical protein CF336_g7193 [Tilletia laevis]
MWAWSYAPTTPRYWEPSRKGEWLRTALIKSSAEWPIWNKFMQSASNSSGSLPRRTKQTTPREGSQQPGHNGSSSRTWDLTQPTGSRPAGEGEDDDERRRRRDSGTPLTPSHIASRPRKTFAEVVSTWSSKRNATKPTTLPTNAATTPPPRRSFAEVIAAWSDKSKNKIQPKTSSTATSPSTLRPPLSKRIKGKGIRNRTFTPKTIAVKAHKNRPPVLGDRRFATWVPEPIDGVPSQPTPVRKVLLAAFAKGTLSNYSTGLAQWHNFCDTNNVPERDRGPAKPELVELWVSQHAGTKSGGYLKDWIAALKAWHHVNNLPWLANEDRIQLIRRGAVASQPPPKPQRPPMTPPAVFGASSGQGKWELVLKKISDFDPRPHVKRTDLKTETTVINGRQSTVTTVKLPRSKTSVTGHVIVLTSQDTPSDPIGLLHLHLQLNQVPNPESSPLFSYWNKGRLSVLNQQAFERTLKQLADRAKLPHIHGHSMRIGGCTTLLVRGVPPDKVMLHGRWDSNSFKRYIREHAAILAPFLAANVDVRQQLVAADPEIADVLEPQQDDENEQAEGDLAEPRARVAHAPAAHGQPATPAMGSGASSPA